MVKFLVTAFPIFFDTETNGLSSNNSVLSISATKVIVDYDSKSIEIVDTYERFYYPIEEFSNEANLDAKTIGRYRKGVKYSRHFKYDQNDFLDFIDETKHFVAHNIEFDRKFLNFNI